MNICVYGASSQQIHTEYLQAAQDLGAALGEAGFSLVFGAGDTGVMGACARGIARTQGAIIGVAPRFFDKEGVLYQNCTEMIFTDTIRQRKQIMESRADAFVMAPGGIGTLEEFFEILTLKQLGRHCKPIAVLNTRGYFDSLASLLDGAVREGFLEATVLSMYRMFREPGDLADYLQKELVNENIG